jgi:hypothetical protein
VQPAFAGIQLPASRAWNPAAGGSLSWQAERTNIAVSYSHIISGGGGLQGAIRSNSASASVLRQLSRRFSASASAAYSQNDVIGASLSSGQSSGGHTITGTVSVQHQFGDHVSFQAGYTRVHQDYGDIPLVSSNPNTNREFVSLSYQISRPLGR